MKPIAFILTLLAMATSLVSCNEQVKEERIQRIDSLGIHLNYVDESLQDMDSVLLVNRTTEIDNTSSWVYDNITDTLDRVPGLTFGDYMRTKKYLGQSLERYDQVQRELRYSSKQLKSLREDVLNSFYSEEEFSGYFNTEAQSVKRLVDATDELKEKYQMSNDRYTKFKPKVNAIVDSIKAVIYDSKPVKR